ncbi:polyketide synthase Pks13 [Corynebacterium choanae]|uniref:Phthiocerol/phenolphthiocerol synthesis polyketide synthase type I PpsA n=1 Tax=Corynebacterium choanae TaxID=1862358 RepID=A0A3G6J3Q2_9CORY|nr:polyketide synthase Pks13 [Corynebacterium choanae]AZA12556.1 Phthiocerol/phenolphthiocerol synthesis polyketide synthase type I PpsA [Corynebacterium choanae]
MDSAHQQPADMSTSELRAWLSSWVAQATGLDEAAIDGDQPMQNLGLTSRDAVVLSGELEHLLGRQLDATVAYEHPSINALADFLTTAPSAGGVSKRMAAQSTVTRDSRPEQRDIAIVGMAARFPQAESLEQMWDTLVGGVSAVGDLPAGRWSEYANDAVMAEKLKETNVTGGYLSDIASFDAAFFGLSPLEAANMDPQQRIALELAWEALAHARLDAAALKGSNVGVYVGSTNNDYGMLISADPAEAHPYALTGTASSIIANRLSYFFDFTGPSVAVDTACSSSLVAIHHAVRALRDGDCDTALAGGVNILASPFVTTAFGELGVISPSGAIHAFSDDADGFVRGDGAGLLVLKRVADALADGDEIFAVIKGSAVNSDGRSNGITAPKPEAQVDVLARAYADAGVDPQQVDYVEAHGTGTLLGDPIEARALAEVLGSGRDAASPLLLGSAKTNFGHTEAAAGSAGLIKVVLAMQHGVLPPSLHYTAPNRHIDFDAGHLEVVEDPREWPQYSGKPVAGVSGFGFGGTNAHAVVSAFDPADYTDQPHTVQGQLAGGERVYVPISAHLPSRRADQATQLADQIAALVEAGKPVDVSAIARSLARANHGRSTAVVAATTPAELVTRLRALAEGKRVPEVITHDAPSARGVVFAYTGFGSQHRKMAKDLMAISPLFAARIEELNALIEFESGWSLTALIDDDGQTYNTETAQVAITAIQIALTDLLANLGAKPAAVTAMSMGEIAAAYACGGLSAEDAMRVACHRARLMGEGEASLSDDEQGAMAVVELSADQLAELVEQHPQCAGVEPAVYAGPGMTTVGGPRPAVVALGEILEEQGSFFRLLDVKGAGHTSMVEPLLGELAAESAGITPQPITVPLYSSVDEHRCYQPGETVHTVDYFLRCTRGQVYFTQACEDVFGDGFDCVVEISPNPVGLMGLAGTAFAVGKFDAQLLPSLKRKVDPRDSLTDVVTRMWAMGQPVQLRQLLGDGPLQDLPVDPFNRNRFWTAARPSSTATPPLPGSRVRLPDGSLAFSTLADFVPSTAAILEAAAEAYGRGGQVTAVEEHATLPATGEITTVVKKTIGGITIAMYHVDGDNVTFIAEAFAATGVAPATPQQPVLDPGLVTTNPVATDDAAAAQATGLPPVETRLWDPASGETVEQRLMAIVSESMGYEVEDLPAELPLIDLGLDSLMGMRIKNRVENDFQIPPLQVQALRDASVQDVIAMVEELVAQSRNSNTTAGSDTQTDSVEHTAHTTTTPQPTVQGTSETTGKQDSVPTGDTDKPREQAGVGVAPRDASERMVFGTIASILGKAPAGVTSPLGDLTDEQATTIAERLQERSGATITAADVRDAESIEPLANIVRESFETEVEGNIRVLRERPAGSTKPAVFLFHPAGGSSVVYQPLTRRLPDDVPVYGVERLEGTIDERAKAYLEEIETYAQGHPVVLGGWSLGGALAFEVAHQLVDSNVDVAYIALLDTVRPKNPAPNTMEETKARWQRYAAFAKKTYGLEFPVPYELLETAGEDALLDMLETFLATTDASEHGLSAGVLEHQRASFVDNRLLAKLDLNRWQDVTAPVILYRAERMHDGAVELEPAYADIAEDGGWKALRPELEIVHLKGDHLAVVDEPAIGIVGVSLTEKIATIDT